MRIQTARLHAERERRWTPLRVCGHRANCEKRFMRISEILISRPYTPNTIEPIRTLKNDSALDRKKLYSAGLS
jgi:hypothetical protein